MVDVSILIPVAAYHASLLERALNSVRAQTVTCKAYYMNDDDMAGAGAIRNQLLNMVDTPYVVFLDADDWLEPQFVERCLAEIKPNRYVYTDWYQDAQVIKAPERAYCPPQWAWHHITALVPTDAARMVEGFDESLEAMEDTDFFCKLRAAQVCGLRVRQPLVHYSVNGQRAREARESGREILLRQEIFRRHDGNMGCCIDAPEVNEMTPLGQRQENDVLVRARWEGNRVEFGRVTGRRYQRISYPRTTWVDIRDAEYSTELWEIIPESLAVSPPNFPNGEPQPPRYQGLDGFEQVLRQTGTMPAPKPVPVQIDRNVINPDVQKILEMARQGLKKK